MGKFIQYSALKLARHVSDFIGPSSGAFCTSCIRRLWYVVIRILLDMSSRYEVTAGLHIYYMMIHGPYNVKVSAPSFVSDNTWRLLGRGGKLISNYFGMYHHQLLNQDKPSFCSVHLPNGCKACRFHQSVCYYQIGCWTTSMHDGKITTTGL